jgi:hypothetical protein
MYKAVNSKSRYLKDLEKLDRRAGGAQPTNGNPTVKIVVKKDLDNGSLSEHDRTISIYVDIPSGERRVVWIAAMFVEPTKLRAMVKIVVTS